MDFCTVKEGKVNRNVKEWSAKVLGARLPSGLDYPPDTLPQPHPPLTTQQGLLPRYRVSTDPSLDYPPDALTHFGELAGI